MPNHGKYPDELRDRAVRMVVEHGHEYGSQWEATCSVAEKLGPKPETVRQWVRQTERGPRALGRGPHHRPAPLCHRHRRGTQPVLVSAPRAGSEKFSGLEVWARWIGGTDPIEASPFLGDEPTKGNRIIFVMFGVTPEGRRDPPVRDRSFGRRHGPRLDRLDSRPRSSRARRRGDLDACMTPHPPSTPARSLDELGGRRARRSPCRS